MGESQEAETEEPETAMEDLVPRQNISGNFYRPYLLTNPHATDPGFLLSRIRALVSFFDQQVLQVFEVKTLKKAFWIVNFFQSRPVQA